MGWQERFRELGERLTAGQISTDEYRVRSEEILREADREARETEREAVVETQPTQPLPQPASRRKVPVRIPRSAAWEEPSGEMTQIVGTRDETTLVGRPAEETSTGENEPDK